MARIQLPANWIARPYQVPFWRAMMNKVNPLRRAAVVWPRRAGKDRTALAVTSVKMAEKPAAYWHMLPTNVQARKVIWDAVDRQTGLPLVDRVFPKELVKAKNEAEMGIELKNGSKWYAVGSDNYNRLVGSDPFGVVFSEYSLADPGAWNYIRPILAENGGWAMFLYTPRGRNHGYTMYNMACSNPDWFCELLSTEQTRHISLEDIEVERRAGMSEELIQQEFYCSFTAGAAGSYYGKEMEEMRKEKRICEVPYDPNYAVELWFDLGYNDATAVWVMQPKGMQLCAVRYAEFQGMGIPRIAREVRQWGYRLDLLRLPHDGDVHDQTSGRTRTETWEDEFKAPSEVSPRPRNKDQLAEQINAVRRLLPSVWMDGKLCEQGAYALESYHRVYDEKLMRTRDEPRHDWASHGADAMRTGAVRHVPGLFGGGAEDSRAMLRHKPRVIRARGGRRAPQPVDWRNI